MYNNFKNMENKIDEIIKDKFMPMKNFDEEKAWLKVFNKINETEKNINNNPFTKILIKHTKIAALILLLLGIGIILFLILYKNFNLNNYTTINVTEKKLIMLPDQSEIWLNKNSKLKYFKNFTKNREIYLEGEAYFLVKKLDNRPFKLIIKNGTVLVVGTSFYVTSKKGINTKIYVETGKIIFAKKVKNLYRKNIIINAGYFYNELDDNNYYLGKEIDANFMAWKTGKLVFNFTPLSKVFETIENVYDCKIIYDKTIANCEYTATFNNQNIHSVIKTIVETFDLTVSKKGENKYILKLKNNIQCD